MRLYMTLWGGWGLSIVIVLCGSGVFGFRRDCAAGFKSFEESRLQVPLQDTDCDEIHGQEETKEGLIMGYGRSMVFCFGSRVVVGAD
jgi:hypothetical protein